MKGKYNSGVHSTLVAVVGAYILYIAWQLFDKYRNNAGEMPPVWNITAIIVLGIGGLGTLYYAWRVYSQGKKAEEHDNEEENDQGKK